MRCAETSEPYKFWDPGNSVSVVYDNNGLERLERLERGFLILRCRQVRTLPLRQKPVVRQVSFTLLMTCSCDGTRGTAGSDIASKAEACRETG